MEFLNDQSIVETTNAIFECRVSSCSTPTISWEFTQHGTTVAIPIADITGTVSPRYHVFYGTESSSLVIDSVQFPDDVGVYTCITTEEQQTITSSGSLDVTCMFYDRFYKPYMDVKRYGSAESILKQSLQRGSGCCCSQGRGGSVRLIVVVKI